MELLCDAGGTGKTVLGKASAQPCKGGCFMELDYSEIGRRIAKRRKELGLKQSEVEERADIGFKYLSSIERAISIPSLEVIMRLAIALDTTPDEFLVGTVRQEDERWKNVAQRLRGMDARQLDLADSFLTWLSDQKL
jgi:transcriptional regulator with XRE-family HTH domain